MWLLYFTEELLSVSDLLLPVLISPSSLKDTNLIISPTSSTPYIYNSHHHYAKLYIRLFKFENRRKTVLEAIYTYIAIKHKLFHYIFKVKTLITRKKLRFHFCIKYNVFNTIYHQLVHNNGEYCKTILNLPTSSTCIFTCYIYFFSMDILT